MAVMVRTQANQLLPQLLMEQFDTLLTQCRHNEYMHEVVWFTKNILDEITAMRTDNFSGLYLIGVMLVL